MADDLGAADTEAPDRDIVGGDAALGDHPGGVRREGGLNHVDDGGGHGARDSQAVVRPFKLAQRLDTASKATIIARYRSGESSTSLAAVFGVSKNSVIKLLRDAGVPIRRQGLTNEQIDDAARLYEAGQSLAKIGRQLGVDHGTVWRQLKNCGVRMRDTHGRER